MKLKDITKKIENKYPTCLAYDWDNVGVESKIEKLAKML